MATGQNSERQPLLNKENVNYNQYVEGRPTAPLYNELDVPSHIQTPTPVTAVEPDELPPPYASTVHGSPVVTCRICGLTIDISGKDDQHVVQCSHCHEATPIKCAPLGKKYVRCPCNCLLICKISSKKISCPRQNCKRIICLSPSSLAPIQHSSGVCQVICPYCQGCFTVNLIRSNSVKCALCRRKCALIPEYARKRALASFIVAICNFIILIIVAATTHNIARANPTMYIAYFALVLSFLLCLARSWFYFTLRAVTIETPT